MANKAKGWNVLNHRKQIEANRSRNKVEKIVSKDGDFLCFMLMPAKRLYHGWTININDRKRERIAIKQALQKEKTLTRAQRRRFMRRRSREGARA